MNIYKNQIIKTIGRKPIVYDLFFKESKENLPLVIFCHGFKSYKDWGAWNLLAEYFANEGFAFLKFNFSHSGTTTKEPIGFSDLEAFSENTFTKEMDDLDLVIDHLISNYQNENFDFQKINLLGHSRGGSIAILKTFEDERITKIMALAPVANFEGWFGTPEEFEKWKEEGITYIENKRTGDFMPIKFDLYEDFIANKNRLDIPKAVKSILKPIGIVHGEEDPTTLPEHSKYLYSLNQNLELTFIPKADHVFNTKEPWESINLSPELEITAKKVVSFFHKSKQS